MCLWKCKFAKFRLPLCFLEGSQLNFCFSKKFRQIKAGQNNKYDITKKLKSCAVLIWLIFIGHTGSPIRSPLKEKNDTPSVRGRSPIKTTYSSPSKNISSPKSKMSPSKFNSPVRTGTFKVQKKTEETPTTSTSYRTLYEVSQICSSLNFVKDSHYSINYLLFMT